MRKVLWIGTAGSVLALCMTVIAPGAAFGLDARSSVSVAAVDPAEAMAQDREFVRMIALYDPARWCGPRPGTLCSAAVATSR